MEENIITWNVANWVSVVLMAAIGFTVFAFIQNKVAGRREAA